MFSQSRKVNPCNPWLPFSHKSNIMCKNIPMPTNNRNFFLSKIRFLCNMSLYVSSLNSGSNGNCYYVGNHSEAVLIDAGISCREIEKRMKRLGLSLQNVKAVFISHEHNDHICGIRTLVNRFRIPVYITPATLASGGLEINPAYTKSFSAYAPVHVGSLSITAFPKFHDACDPHSFIVDCNRVKVGIFTDIGTPCDHVKMHFRQCHAAFLESNYDEEMLRLSAYPYSLKNRISGNKGHLSNRQAFQFFQENRSPFMSHLFLSHLSANNNHPTIVGELFKELAGNTNIIVASRYAETPVYTIEAGNYKYDVKPRAGRQLQFAF